MSDYPAIMCAPMVRALLREVEAPSTGKTMTRRLRWSGRKAADGDGFVESRLARVRPGDRLWVKETHWRWGRWRRAGKTKTGRQRWCFVPMISSMVVVAFEQPAIPTPKDRTKEGWYKRPSIFLPRQHSRLTLIISATKIERLQDISNDDCEAEGIESELWDQAVGYRNYEKPNAWFCTWPQGPNDPHAYTPADQIQRRSFRSLWENLHGPASWADNPEVVAPSFTVHRVNIDAMSKEIAA